MHLMARAAFAERPIQEWSHAENAIPGPGTGRLQLPGAAPGGAPRQPDLRRHLAAEGLKTSQYSILAKLGRLGPLSINELAKLMVMDRTTLGRAVQPLERDKLLAIAADEDGARRSCG